MAAGGLCGVPTGGHVGSWASQEPDAELSRVLAAGLSRVLAVGGMWVLAAGVSGVPAAGASGCWLLGCLRTLLLGCLRRQLPPASRWALGTHCIRAFPSLTVHLWGTEEVAAWLEHLSLCEYKDIFTRHDIRGSELLHLERRDLKVLP